MSLSLPLRNVTPTQAAHARALAWLRAGNIPLISAEVGDVPALQFIVRYEQGELDVRVPANAWAQRHASALLGCAWHGVSPQTLASLITSHGPGVELPPLLANYQQVRFIACVRLADADRLIAIESPTTGLLWIAGAHGQPPYSQCETETPVSLQLRLPDIAMPATDWAQVEPGDLLLWPAAPMTGSAWLGSQPIFTFKPTESHVEVIETIAPEAPACAEESALGRLSIPLRVVLCHVPLTLSKLSTLEKGALIPLPANAHLSVQLHDAGRVVAVGELVRVGEGLGIEITAVELA